jgi:hypothetical protein
MHDLHRAEKSRWRQWWLSWVAMAKGFMPAARASCMATAAA